MGRIKKGENKPGRVDACVSCGVEKYHAPSQVPKTAFKCMKCRVANAFQFSCVVCKKIVKTQPAQIRLKNRKTCSHKCKWLYLKPKIEERRKGYTKHQLDRLARYSLEASNWRKAIFNRDDYTCQMCGVRGAYLEADHIKPWAYFPELRFEMSNGRTLCRKCHDTTKISAKEMRARYSQVLDEIKSIL